jgi:hypothetical protein
MAPAAATAINAYATLRGISGRSRPAAQPASKARAGIAATTRTDCGCANIGTPGCHEDTKVTKGTKSLQVKSFVFFAAS